jgi:cation:H+ antiporter
MSEYMSVILFIAGLVLIIKGGDWFVDASIWIARVTGIPSIIVGATIVSFATTLPELLVSTNATLKGSTDIAIGNAIGSTICNMGLIAGLVIFLRPVEVSRKIFTQKAFLMVFVTLLTAFMARENYLSRLEAVLLLSTMGLYFYVNIKAYQGRVPEDRPIFTNTRKEVLVYIGKFAFGSLLVILGADLLVTHGIILAQVLGVPESVIGLTLIALGTSLPELVTGITSVLKKDAGIGLGNIIGANILNISMILGASGLIAGKGLYMTLTDVSFLGFTAQKIPQTLFLDLPVSLLLMALLAVPPILSGRTYRLQGIGLMLLYGIYVIILFNLG